MNTRVDGSMLGDHFDRPFHRCFVEESTGVDGSMLESTPPSLLRRSMQSARRARQSLATRSRSCCKSPIFRGSEMLPQTDKIDPRGIKNRAETAQGAPRSAHERQRAPQERPRAAQERPKSAPRASQERPRAPQEHPRAPQEPLKSVQRRPRQRSGHHFEASGSKKAAFEGDLARDSVEKRVGNDFRSIFASCAQERTCEKPIKTYGFT